MKAVARAADQKVAFRITGPVIAPTMVSPYGFDVNNGFIASARLKPTML